MDEDKIDVDWCIQCQEERPSSIWPNCKGNITHTVVHIGKCKFCDNSIGYEIDDDYCGPTTIVCPSCLLKP